MKIDFSGIIRAINDFFTAKTMTTAERILIRQKKDLYNYLAIHFPSIIKSLLVFVLLNILIQQSNCIQMNIFWIYLLTGLIFLIFNPLGFRALFFLIFKYIN